MRTLRIALLAAGLLVLEGMPAGATELARGVYFSISPVGGTSGTSISVRGQCTDSADGDAYLERPAISEAISPPDSHAHFTVNDAMFSAALQSPYRTENGYPVDAQVRVVCGPWSSTQPFQGSSTPLSGTTPSILASLGTTPCGFAFVAPPTDPRSLCPPHVKGFDANGALATTNFVPGHEDTHGVSVAIGDVSGDGNDDIVTGSGRGAAVVEVFQPNGAPEGAIYPYGDFSGGVNVAVGDVNGDGRQDIITGAGPGGGPHVEAFSFDAATGQSTMVASFFAYDPQFSGGVNVAAGQLSGTNRADIVTGPMGGGGPHVRRFDATGTPIGGGFFAYDPNFSGGVSVAVLPDAFTHIGRIVTGAGQGGGPDVRVFDANGSPLAGWFAYDPAFNGGVSVAAGRISGASQIVTGAGPGGGPQVRIFSAEGTLNSNGWYAFGSYSGAGIRVAVAP